MVQAEEAEETGSVNQLGMFGPGGLFSAQFLSNVMPNRLNGNTHVKAKMKSLGSWHQAPDGVISADNRYVFEFAMSLCLDVEAFADFRKATIRNHGDSPRYIWNRTKEGARQAVEDKGFSTREVKSSTFEFMTLLLDNDERVWAARLLVARAFFLGDITARKQSVRFFNQYPELEEVFGGRPAWVDDPSRETGPLVEKSALPDYDALLSGEGDGNEADDEERAGSVVAYNAPSVAGDTPLGVNQRPSGEENDVGLRRLFHECSVLQALIERIRLAGGAGEAEWAMSGVVKELADLRDKVEEWKKEEEGTVRAEREEVIAKARKVAEAAERVRRRTGGKDAIDVEAWRQQVHTRASNFESGEMSAIHKRLNECLATIESEEQELASILDGIKKSVKEAGDDLESAQRIIGRGARTQKAVVERLRTAMNVALESITREGELIIGTVSREHDEGATASDSDRSAVVTEMPEDQRVNIEIDETAHQAGTPRKATSDEPVKETDKSGAPDLFVNKAGRSKQKAGKKARQKRQAAIASANAERPLEQTEEAERLARDEKADRGRTPPRTEKPEGSRVPSTAKSHVQGQEEIRQETVSALSTAIPTTEKAAGGAAKEPSICDTRKLLMSAMARGDAGGAFQLQRARLDLHPELAVTPDLDPRILWAHALIQSREWGVDIAELSRTVDEAALDYPQEKHHGDDIRRMQALLAGLASIGSALTTGSTTAAALFQQADGLASVGLPEIHNILHTLTENQRLMMSVDLGTLRGLSVGKEAGSKADEVSKEFAALIDKPTNIAVLKWCKSGLLSEIRDAMARGKPEDVKRIDEFLDRFYRTSKKRVGLNESEVYRQMMAEGAEYGKGGKLRVETWAQKTVNRFFGNLCALASQWDKAKRFEADTEKKTAFELQRLMKDVADDLKKLKLQISTDPKGSLAVEGTCAIARPTVERLLDILSPLDGDPSPEKPFRHVLAATVAAELGLSINTSYTVDESAEIVIDAFTKQGAAQSAGLDMLEENLEKGRFLSAEITYELVLEQGLQIDEAAYRKKYKKALGIKRAKLKKQRDKLRDEVDIAAGKGILGYEGEAQLERFRRVVESIEPENLPMAVSDEITYPESDVTWPEDISAADQYFKNEREKIRNEKRRRGLSIRRSLEDLIGKEQILPSVIAQVRKALDRENYSAAQEFLNAPDAMPVDAGVETQPLLEEFQDFIPKVIKAIGTKATTVSNAAEVAGFLSGGDLGLELADEISESRAVEVISTWRRLGLADGKAAMTAITVVLETLGFDGIKVGAERKMRPSHTGPKYTVQTARINDRSLIPIYQYGSAAQGRYMVSIAQAGCSWQDVCKELGPEPADPIIVLFKEVLRDNVRITIREAVVKNNMPMIVIDQGLFIYSLTKQPSDRLSAIFHVALPYTNLNPYRIVEGVSLNEMFVGRQAQMREIIDLDGANFVYGGRQLGKTALLMQAEANHHDPERGRYVITVRLKRNLGEPEHFWEQVGEELTAHDIVRHATKASTIEKRIREFLDKDEKRQIILFVDEADAFLDHEIRPTAKSGRTAFAELDRIKRLMTSTRNRFKIVLCGLHNVMRHDEATRDNSPLLHMQQGVLIGPFDNRGERLEAVRFVQQPLNAMGYVFEDSDLPYQIIAEMNFYPSLIMLFCSELMKHLTQRGDSHVPATISVSDIESVQASSRFRDAQEMRFFGTLDLDQRYALLCRVIVGHIFDQKNGSRLNAWMDIQNIAEEAEVYWEEAFASDTDSEVIVRALLEEMVQLGVLRKIAGKSDRYTLRSINLLMLFKDRSTNQKELEKFSTKKPPSPAAEPAHYRIPGDPEVGPASFERSVITYANFKRILQPDMATRPVIVFGSAMSGITELQKWMRIYRRNIEITEIDTAVKEADLKDQIARLTPPKGAGDEIVQIVFVAPTVPWTLGWCNHVRGLLAKRRLRLVMMGDLRDAQVILSELDGETGDEAEADIIEATGWNVAFVLQWVQELGIDCLDEPETIRAVDRATAFLPTFMRELGRINQKGPAQLRALVNENRYEELLTDPVRREIDYLSFEHRTILNAFAEFGADSPTSVDEIVEIVEYCQDIDLTDAREVAKALRACGFLVSGGKEHHYRAPACIQSIF